MALSSLDEYPGPFRSETKIQNDLLDTEKGGSVVRRYVCVFSVEDREPSFAAFGINP